MSLLEVSGLTVDIAGDGGPARVLEDISFTVPAAGAVGIVGESGCGKSMTALAVMGLLPEGARLSGSIRLAGEELVGRDDAEMSAIRGRRIAMVFQEPMTALNPVRTIGDQVAEGVRLHLGLSKRAAQARARHLLDRVGLPAGRFPLTLYPHQLSGGQRQRVVIAIALAAAPELLIADEPTTALDVTVQAQILDLLAEVTAEEGMALLIISHDLGVVAETTDELLVMYAGWVVEKGPTAAIFSHRAHPYTQGLFAAVPASQPVGRRLATIPGRVPDAADLPPGCRYAPRCPRARPRCRAEVPATFPFPGGIGVRCFYPGLDEAPG